MSVALLLNESGVTAPESLWHKALQAIGCILVAEKPAFAGEGVTGCIASAQHVRSSRQTHAKGLGYLSAAQQKAGGYLTTSPLFETIRPLLKTTGAGFSSLNHKGGQSRQTNGGIFSSVALLRLFPMAGGVGKPSGLPVPLCRSANPTFARHPRLAAWAVGYITHKGIVAMRHIARGASLRASLSAHIERITSRFSRRTADYLAGALIGLPLVFLLAQGVTR